jgi:hypothetical protein
MSFATLFLIVFVLYPIACLMLLLTLCLAFEYYKYRGDQIIEEQLRAVLGERDETDVDSNHQSDILDYSRTSPN